MRRGAKIAAVGVTAALAVGAVVAHDPYLLVRAHYERQRVMAGLAEDSIDVAGHRWVYAHVDEAPAGAPTLVMLHGFTGSKENWYPLAQRLRGRYRLLVPDLPGWGESERQPDADYGYAAQAARTAEFIARIAGTDGVVLLGHSMGGGIAALVAARHPQFVDRVGMLAASGVLFEGNAFGHEVLAGDNPFAVSDAASLRGYLDILFHRAGSRPWIPWPASRGMIRKRRADAAFEQSVLDRIGRGPERFLPGEAADRIDQPALLLWGRQDAVIDPSALDVYAADMPQAHKVLVDDAGHMALMERPDEVAAAVVALVEQPHAGQEPER